MVHDYLHILQDEKKSQFWTSISFYFGNDTRQGYSYYRTPIRTRMRCVENGWRFGLMVTRWLRST